MAASPLNGNTAGVAAADTTQVSNFITLQSLGTFAVAVPVLKTIWELAKALAGSGPSFTKSYWMAFGITMVYAAWQFALSGAGLKQKNDWTTWISAGGVAVANAAVVADALIGLSETTNKITERADMGVTTAEARSVTADEARTPATATRSAPQSDEPGEQRIKLGLALSAGGFRASTFHLGVLARLAELGILRQVEVLSTVSGGSIVGAFHYLHTRRLVQDEDLESMTLAPEQIDEKYIEMLRLVVSGFRATVQKNPRARLLLNPFKNLPMAVPGFYFQHFGLNFGIPYYSRTDRVGDLLDRLLYRQAFGKPEKRRWLKFVDQQIRLCDIKIQPKGAPPNFDPGGDNPSRSKAKVPILLLNASSLNTGHNWRFEAIGMGEPVPEDPLTKKVFDDVQGNQLLAEGYFEGPHPLAPRQQDFPLAMAVAASAAVPGIFHPLSITG